MLTPQQVKQEQHEQWSRAAAGWRKHDERLRSVTAPVTERLLRLSGVAAGHRVLDIASGTGEPGLPAAQIAGPEGHVLLTDMSQEMLDVAREKAETQGLRNVSYQRVDGEELEVTAGSFDAAQCRFGMMFMPEPVRCLQQVHRALKPGGRFAVAVWGPPEGNPFFTLPLAAVRKHAEVPQPDPGAPGIFAFADREKLDAVFNEARFRDVQTEELALPMAVFDSGHDMWAYMKDMAGPLVDIVANLPAEKQAAIGEEVATAAGGGDPNAPVSLMGLALLAVGTKTQ